MANLQIYIYIIFKRFHHSCDSQTFITTDLLPRHLFHSGTKMYAKVHGDVDARVHIYTVNALARGRMTSPMRGRLCPPVLILQEAEWISRPIWTWRSKEKFPPLFHPGSNPGRPAHSQAPCPTPQCRNNDLTTHKKCIMIIKTWY